MVINIMEILTTGIFVVLILLVMIISFVILFLRNEIHNLQKQADLRHVYDEETLKAHTELQDERFQVISNDLRDNIGQLLSVTKLYIHVIEEMNADSQVRETVSVISGLMARTINEVRSLSRYIDEDFVKNFGIVNSITSELNRIQKTGGIATDFNISGEAFELGFKREIILLRIIQEVFNIVIKYSLSDHLVVHIRFESSDLNLSIAHNGRGLDYFSLENEPNGAFYTDIRKIYSRISLIGGTCKIETGVEEGPKVIILVKKDLGGSDIKS